MPETFLVGWKCRKCGHTMSGWLLAGQSTDGRVCESNSAPGVKYYPARVRRKGKIIPYICDGVMEVIHDERPPKLNVLVMERDPPLTEKQRIEEEGAMRGSYVRKGNK